MAETDILAYYKISVNYDRKKSYSTGPEGYFYKKITDVIYEFCKKLECLSLANHRVEHLKSFIGQAPRVIPIKLFTAVIYEFL